MASRTVVTLECDLCHRDETETDGVETHRVTVDGNAVEAEACLECWARAIACLDWFARAGRAPEPKRLRIVSRDPVPWPGEAWQFTSHALVRIGERFLNPVDVIRVADHPATTYPGVKEGLLVCVGKGGLKVVVNPSRRTIVTASSREEEVEDVA